MDVVTTALLGNVIDVAFKALLTVTASLNFHFEEGADLHLDRYEVVADVIDEENGVLAGTLLARTRRHAAIFSLCPTTE